MKMSVDAPELDEDDSPQKPSWAATEPREAPHRPALAVRSESEVIIQPIQIQGHD
jgi:hypothetical protein